MGSRVPKISLFRRGLGEDALLLKKHRVADFRYSDKIASGGMADVYWEQVTDELSVAVKVPSGSLWTEPKKKTKSEAVLCHEMKLLARLGHPNIVDMLAGWQSDDVWRYAMEYCSHSVASVIEAGDIPRHYAFYIFREVGKALQYVHENGIVHQDVKPGNVLMQDSWNPEGMPAVKLCDFGIARNVYDVPVVGLVSGTPGYMSPEYLSGAIQFDTRNDMFALGCMLFKMLGNRLDCTADSSTAIYCAAEGNREAMMAASDFDPEVNELLFELSRPDGVIVDGAALTRYLNVHMPWVIHEIPQTGERFDASQSFEYGAALYAGDMVPRPQSQLETLLDIPT